MKSQKDLTSKPADVQNRARGAMIGLAIGDSFGDACRVPDNQMTYGFMTDFKRGATWSTDDTEFALLTADTLVQCNGQLTDEAVHNAWMKYVVTQDELKRGGASEIEAALNLRKGLRAPLTGRYNAYAHSDGAAMRSAPIGVVCAGNVERAIELAGIDASISHDREGVWGAQSVAAAVAAAMADADFEEIFQAAMLPVPEGTWFHHAMTLVKQIVRETEGNVLAAWMPLHDELRCSYKAAVSEAVAAAFGILLLSHDSFSEGIIVAGNYGRDADTIGAVCGAVLGAKFGYAAIPDAWAQKPRYPSGTCLPFTKGMDVLSLADALAAIANQS